MSEEPIFKLHLCSPDGTLLDTWDVGVGHLNPKAFDIAKPFPRATIMDEVTHEIQVWKKAHLT